MTQPVPRRGPARAESLSALGGFLGLMLLLVVAVDVRFPQWLDREYEVRKAALGERVAEAPDRPVLLVLGSSRMGTGFMPERVGPVRDAAGREVLVFNYSHVGAGPTGQLVQAHRAARDGVRPAWAVVELSPPLLADDEFPPRTATVREVGLVWPYARNRADLVYRAAMLRVGMAYHVRTPLVRNAAPPFATRREGVREPQVLPLGGADNWARIDHPTPEQRAHLLQVAEERHRGQMQRFRISPRAAAAARELLAYCQGQGIQVALLHPPEDTRFRSWYGPGAENEVRAVAAGLQAEFAAPLIDARSWVPDDEFTDPHHLNLTGAERFTARLGDEVLRPLAAGRLGGGAPSSDGR